jgi:hypothetical protein
MQAGACEDEEAGASMLSSVTTMGMWLQEPGSLSSGNSRLLMIFVGLVAVCMLVQALVVVVFAVGAMKSQKRMLSIAEELRTKAMPVIDSAEDLFHDSVPKLKVLVENLAETSHIVRSKAQEFDATMSDANRKTRAQVARMDGMMSSALTATEALAESIHESIRVPVKQMAGVVNGFKAGLDVLLSKAKGFGGPR